MGDITERRAEQSDEKLQIRTFTASRYYGMTIKLLEERGIRNIKDLGVDDVLWFRLKVMNLPLSDSQKNGMTRDFELALRKSYEDADPEMAGEIREAVINPAAANKLVFFLSLSGIKDINEINYDLRKEFKRYLSAAVAKKAGFYYLEAFDNLKLYMIRKRCSGLRKPHLVYGNREVFLLYHPDYAIAQSFRYVRNKEDLAFDFSLPVSDKLKHQVYQMLEYILETQAGDSNAGRHDRRARFILPLKRLYWFCCGSHIDDIETLTKKDVEGFRESLDGQVGTLTKEYMQIVDNTQKFLFLSSDEVNWNATVWYMERFHFQEDRSNPAEPIRRFSFRSVENSDNRRLFQEFMKYQIGISQRRTIKTVQYNYYGIMNLMRFCDDNHILLAEIGINDIDRFAAVMQKQQILPDTYNIRMASVFGFIGYLQAKGFVQDFTIFPDAYYKKSYKVHHARSLNTSQIDAVLDAMSEAPEQFQIILLILYVTGLRVNEVCLLTWSSFLKDNGTWLQIHQRKLKTDKKIPIPGSLYEVIRDYKEMRGLCADDYLFQNRKGGPIRASNFCKWTKAYLQKKIDPNFYSFASHDWRHTIATDLFNDGTDINVIRQFLGHTETEMTEQYVDHISNTIDSRTHTYYENKGELAQIALGGESDDWKNKTERS